MSPVSAKNDQEGQEGAGGGGKKKRQNESRVAITTNCIVTRKLRDYSVRANHAVHVSSVVAREKREKEQETLSEYNGDEEKKREERERKRESKLSRSTHNYRLYFQIAACTLAASSNCLRR